MLFHNAHDDVPFRITDYVLISTGVVFMIIGLVCAALFVPAFLSFAFWGEIYPIIQLSQKSFSLTNVAPLSFFLTVVNIGLLVSLCIMAPFVWSFQAVRTDIVDISSFPEIFYSMDTIRELQVRFMAEIDNRAIDRFLDRKFGRDVVREIKLFLKQNG
jgi:hypothetical protein